MLLSSSLDLDLKQAKTFCRYVFLIKIREAIINLRTSVNLLLGIFWVC